MNALDLALANAAANAPRGEELHLENLDSIADPTHDEPIMPNRQGESYTIGEARQKLFPKGPESTLSEAQLSQLQQDSEQYWANRPAVVPEPPQYDPRDVSFKGHYYPEPEPLKLTLDSIDYKLGEITNAVKSVEARCDAIYDNTNFRLNHISTDIKYILETITAASMSSEPNHKHRSLHEWDDTTLLNELVERENDLMPFYYEILKRIGSSELQSLVMASMQGKNASMVTLAQLCSALAPTPIQHQPSREDMAIWVEQRKEEARALDTQPDCPATKTTYYETPPTYNPYFRER